MSTSSDTLEDPDTIKKKFQYLRPDFHRDVLLPGPVAVLALLLPTVDVGHMGRAIRVVLVAVVEVVDDPPPPDDLLLVGISLGVGGGTHGPVRVVRGRVLAETDHGKVVYLGG